MADPQKMAGNIAQAIAKDHVISRTGTCPDCGNKVTPEQHLAHKVSKAGSNNFFNGSKKSKESK